MENNNEAKAEEKAEEKVEEGNLKYLTRWQHKETKKIFRVVPWWDCHSEIIDKPNDILVEENDTFKDRKFAIGVLVQVGFLIENDQGVWFGLGPDAKDSFDDIGV